LARDPVCWISLLLNEHRKDVVPLTGDIIPRTSLSACASVDQRTRSRESFDGDADTETADGASLVAEEKSRKQRELFGEAPRRVFWQARFYGFSMWTAKKRVEKLRYMHAIQ